MTRCGHPTSECDAWDVNKQTKVQCMFEQLKPLVGKQDVGDIHKQRMVVRCNNQTYSGM